MPTAIVRNGYRYDGESVEIDQPITEQQFRAIERILGEPPARFKGWAERFCFDPPDPGRAAALLKYLGEQNLSHSLERLETWTPVPNGEGR